MYDEMPETAAEHSGADDSADVPESSPEEEPFDAERAKAKISKANSEAKSLRERLRSAEAKLGEYEESQKSDSERQTEKLSALEKRAVEAESRLLRMEVATEKGLTAAQAKRLVGDSREELETDADELIETFRPAASGPVTRTNRPTEIRQGRNPEEPPEEMDPRKLAAKIKRQ